MGNKYRIEAARYPFKGYYEAHFQCDSFWHAAWQLLKYHRQGYDIINFYCRDIKAYETFTWAGE